MSQKAPREEAENPYAAPQVPFQVAEVTATDDMGLQQLHAFVGKRNTRYYLDRWLPMMHGGSTSVA